MGVPLLRLWDEGWSSKEIHVVTVIGRATTAKLGGRDILVKRRKSREFNATKGYPGEDGDCTTVYPPRFLFQMSVPKFLFL